LLKISLHFRILFDFCLLMEKIMYRSDLFAFCTGPTPAYSTYLFPDFYKNKELPVDEQGLFRPLEIVLRPNTFVKVVAVFPNQVWKIHTDEYPDPLFVDHRFMQITSRGAGKRIEQLPNPKQILKKLDFLVRQKIPYIWGGNWCGGVPQLLQLYPPPAPLSNQAQARWIKDGFDCTGLVHYVTNGMCGDGIHMPRNSGDQIKLGEGLPIRGKTAKEIALLLKPLDLVGWKGHVLIVGNNNRIYDSLIGFGVISTNLIVRLEEIMKTRIPKNTYTEPQDFVARRWYPPH
jgi:hypothetical protein